MTSRLGSTLALIGTFGSAVSQWYIVWLFARYSGAEVVGSYSGLLAIISPIFVVGQFGLRTLYLTLHLQAPWRIYIGLRVLGIIFGATLFITFLICDPSLAFDLGMALLLLKSADSILDLFYARIQRAHRMSVLGVLTLANSALTMLLVTAVVLLTGSLFFAVLASALASVAIAVFAWKFARHSNPGTESPEVGYRKLLKAGVPVTISQGLAAFATYLPILFLNEWSTAAVIGVYVSIAYLLTATNLLGSALQTILVTPFRRMFNQFGAEQMIHRAKVYSLIFVGIGLVCIPIATFFGPSIIEYIYGPDFQIEASNVFVLTIASVAIVPSYILGTVLSVLNRYKRHASVYLLSVLAGSAVGLALLNYGVSPIISAGCIAVAVCWSRLIGIYIFSKVARTS